MKKLTLPIILLLTMSCSSKNETISGKFSDAEGQMIYLEELTPTAVVVKDSVKLNNDGAFGFNITVEVPKFFRIRESKNNFFNIILSPEEKVSVTGKLPELPFTYTIEGSEESMELHALNKFLLDLYKENDSLNRELQMHQMQQNQEAFIATSQQQATLIDRQSDFIRSFITKNTGKLVSLAAVTNLKPDEDLSYYLKVADGLKETLPNSEYYTNFNAKVSEFKARMDEIEAQNKKLGIGAQAPDITLSTPEGKLLSLSSLKGKVVLIDFWASWCRPCRAENPNVVKLYNKYKSKGFDVLGVSLDKSKDSWIQAIKQDGLSWNHISDLGHWQSSVVPLYNIEGIPQTYLVDKEGVIIGKNLRGEELESKLAELFE